MDELKPHWLSEALKPYWLSADEYALEKLRRKMVSDYAERIQNELLETLNKSST